MGSIVVAILLASAIGIPGTAHANPRSDAIRPEASAHGPAVTVVEQARFVGSFEKNDLSVIFTGRATPRMPSVDILQFNDARLLGCEGNAIVSRRNGSTYLVTPTSTRFTTRCRLAPEDGSGIRFRQLDALLDLESQVSDGELFVSSSGSWELVRAVAPEDVAPVVVTGRHRLTFDHDERRFRYELTARNPNRSRQPLTIHLNGGERSVDVETVAQWQLDQGIYRFQLPQGSTSIVFSGTLREDSWKPPLEVDRQYVLVESHPLLLPDFETEARRVSPEETGFGSAGRGAQAFLFDKEQTLSWTITVLETLHTASFAVNEARHIFFVAENGEVTGETIYSVNNQGAPALSIPMEATPFYAGVNGQPTFLTPDENGDLRVPIAQGQQRVEVQYRQEVRTMAGFTSASISTPRIAAPAAQSNLEIRLPSEWVPLYQRAAGKGRFNYGVLPLALLLTVFVERALAVLGIARRRLLLAGTIGPAGAVSQVVFWMIVAAIAAIVFVKVLAWWKKNGSLSKLAIAGAAVVLGLMVVTVFGQQTRYLFGSSTAALGGEQASESRRSLRDFGSSTGRGGLDLAAPAPSYQGLPAKITLPWGNEQARFSETMTPADEVIRARVILVSRIVIDALILAVLLLALFLVWERHRELVDAWRRLLRDAGIGKEVVDGQGSDSPSPA